MKSLIEIKQLCKKRGLTQEQLAEKIGMTRSGIQNIFNTNTTSIQTLEKISDVLEIPMTYWFEEITNNVNEQFVNYGKAEKSGNFNNNVLKNHNGDIRITIESKDKEIESLKRELKLKDEIIELLKEKGKGK